MCNHENREAAMTVTSRDETGTATVWCDPCLAPLIRVLNNGGIGTIASCCGHGEYPGWVMLTDGRFIDVYESQEQQISVRYPDRLDAWRRQQTADVAAARSINEGETR